MKNLYILPTEKPSRIRYTHGGNYTLSKEVLSWRFAHHIYITSDEVIQEGDWHLKSSNNTIANYPLNTINPNKGRYKKIILTTDQDLINDGVQAIDDEFLKWFVNNSNCKFVQINYIKDDVYVAGFLATSTFIKYEIVVPKDKWEGLENSDLDTQLITWDNDEETKQIYNEIEHLIITWSLDGTKTAGSLTRQIMSLIKKD